MDMREGERVLGGGKGVSGDGGKERGKNWNVEERKTHVEKRWELPPYTPATATLASGKYNMLHESKTIFASILVRPRLEGLERCSTPSIV